MSPEKTIKALAEHLPVEFVKTIKATDVALVSPRTVKLTIPPTKDGINQIKITLQENGEFRVRTYKVEEVEDVPNIMPGSLVTAIEQLTGMEAA